MPKMSGAEFKLAVFFLRATMGDRDRRVRADMTLPVSLDEITRQTGLDRDAAIKAIRDLEKRQIISAYARSPADHHLHLRPSGIAGSLGSGKPTQADRGINQNSD